MQMRDARHLLVFVLVLFGLCSRSSRCPCSRRRCPCSRSCSRRRRRRNCYSNYLPSKEEIKKKIESAKKSTGGDLFKRLVETHLFD